jgi:AcrR family transcriptional regulator
LIPKILMSKAVFLIKVLFYVSDRSLTMKILQQKPDTKRPDIVQAATSLFAARGIDGVSMRDIAQAAGVREAAIYRHFASKEELAREIFLSWYGWHCQQVHQIVISAKDLREKLRAIVNQEFTVAERYPEAFLYFCATETKFLSALPPEVSSVRNSLSSLLKAGQRQGDLRQGDTELIVDMLSGALCEVALSWVRRQRRNSLRRYVDLVTDNCWRMIATER